MRLRLWLAAYLLAPAPAIALGFILAPTWAWGLVYLIMLIPAVHGWWMTVYRKETQ